MRLDEDSVLVFPLQVSLEPFPFPATLTSLDSLASRTPVVAASGNALLRGMPALTTALYHAAGGASTVLRDCCLAKVRNIYGVYCFHSPLMNSNTK
jgi:hypothetical protein